MGLNHAKWALILACVSAVFACISLFAAVMAWHYS